VIELPEAVTIAGQLNKTVRGKRIAAVVAVHTPHKLAWYYGEPTEFAGLLTGRTVQEAGACGSMVEIKAEEASIVMGEGTAIRFHDTDRPRPARHQLLLEFDDRSALSGVIQMYGGLGAFLDGQLDNYYYRVAKERRCPLSSAFDEAYFRRMVPGDKVEKLSLKGLLATEQRIPGLGNGVLQDILFNAKLHPKKKVSTLSDDEVGVLFEAVRDTLAAMAARGGRDTELDLFGVPGGYATILSRKTTGKPCPLCGTTIKKEAYMGGSIYYCRECQSP